MIAEQAIEDKLYSDLKELIILYNLLENVDGVKQLIESESKT